MVSIITNYNETSSELSKKFRKIKVMKWLLNLEKSEEEFTQEELQKRINEFCYQNFAHLVVLNLYISHVTDKIRGQINNIIQEKEHSELCKKLYFQYLKNCKKSEDFRELEMFIFIHRAGEVVHELEGINENNFEQRIDEVQEVIINQKAAQLSLIYNILENSDLTFAPIDIIQNLPQLFYWIEENKNKPIQELTNDECEIIAAHIYHASYDDMLEKLNFSSFVKDYKDIDNIIKELPKKFEVSNMTQVLFRIFLLKPYIWQQVMHEAVVKAIKGVSNVVK